MARKRFLFYLTVQSILISILFTFVLSIIAPIPSQASNALKLEQQGNSYYEAGRFAEAVKVWQQAADAYKKDEEGKNRNLINKAQALQSLGLYPEACNQITQLFIKNLTCDQLIKNNKNSNDIKIVHKKFINSLQVHANINKVISLRLLGDILQKLDELELANTVLQTSLEASKQYPEYQSIIYISLGNLKRIKASKNRNSLDYKIIVSNILDEDANFNTADFTLNLYQQAMSNYDLAKKQSSILTQTQAELNQISLLVENKQWWAEQIIKINKDDLERLQLKLDNILAQKLPKVELNLEKLPQNREAIYAYINFSNSLIELNRNKKYYPEQKIAKILSTAIQKSRNLGDKQAETLALGSLARLYELQVPETGNLTQQDKLNLDTAKKLTEQALSLSNEINADRRQILYRHRHQLGRILKTQGDIKAALSSYAEAWNILQSLRADLVTNTDNQFSFRQNVEPIYREFIDLLLQADRNKIDFEQLVLQTEGKPLKSPLDTARLVMQSLQLAELDNFFQEPCSPPVAKPVQIDKIDQNAVVIYPIILKNRLEVILYRSGQTTSNYFPVNEDEVKNTLESLASIIYNNTELKSDSALLINSGGNLDTDEFQQQKLERNKKEFLESSERVYDWLIKPLEENNQLDPNNVKTLVFLLDRAFQKIPIAALHDNISQKYLIEKYNVVLNLGQELVETKPVSRSNMKILAAGVSETQYIGKEPFPGLRGVEKELNSIKQFEKVGVATTILPNKNFNQKNLQTQIKTSPTIVHLATHGVFSSNRERTFLVTGNNSTINVDDFQNLLNPQDSINNKNIELLVLSACQTASGDEKAALGMAGVVIRSEASSTIASLWSVSDDATVELMKEFYHNLITRKLSRAEALRNAQISLLKIQKFNHPFYWAPFVLVGNWL
ncbi:hypothetical protein RIVM261_004430 [Rivularia sp. IAM M-261]|nr:hypothetical protein RIVM261_004430 [Rivularia sp. IAM M-261]